MINNIDFTQDFLGVFNKDEVIKYLLSINDLRLQSSYDSAEHTTLDTDFKGSEKCLKLTEHTENGVVRCKFWNKVIQNIERPSVKNQGGSPLADYISNPKDIL